MEPVTYVGSATVSTSPPLQVGGFDIFAVIGNIFSNSGGTGFFSDGGFLSFLGSLWSTFAVLAYIVSIIFLVIYIFASIRRNLYVGLATQVLRDQEKLYEELHFGKEKNGRLQGVFTHAESDNPNDWKLAIIEADIILDETLKQKGFIGNSLGERLKTVSADQLQSVGDAWEAHKVRNKIAHEGADFILTRRVLDETILRYKKVFTEFGVS
jgi:hypothetical protein